MNHLKLKFCLLFCIISMCLDANGQLKPVSNKQIAVRDSVLIYKIQGLKDFVKVADHWGDDTESYWAFEQANNILDSISDFSKYEESLARIYAATSYVSYGLSYFPSVIEASRQHHTGESNSFPKVGIKESSEIIIKDYNLPPNDTLYNVSRLEFLALYSMLYFYKAINLEKFEERILPNFDRSIAYDELFSHFSPQTAYRISSVLNMQVWYNYIVTCVQISHWENNEQAPDLEVMPWKEFIELASWHDNLTSDIEQYEKMDEETFHRIEVKAAYTQYIMLSQIAKNLAEVKKKSSDQKNNK